MKELKKLKEKDMTSLKTQNTSLAKKVVDLKVELALWKDEIRKLKVKTESLERIREVVGIPRDILNKARLFDNGIKMEEEISAAKIVPILVVFTRKMEVALADIRKLVFGSSVGETSWPSMPPPKDTLRKEKPLEEIKTPLPQRLGKEKVAETSHVVPPAKVLATTPSSVERKKVGKDSASSEPSSRMQDSKKKKKEPTLELELEEESTAEDTGSSKEDAESEEEPSTLLSEPKARMGTCSTDKKKPPPVYKSSVTPKRPIKTPQKGEDSNEKARGK